MTATTGNQNEAARPPVGVNGTGLFGSALVECLLADGFSVLVHNRTRSKADPLIARGARWSDNPLVDCERIIFSVYTSGQVAQIIEQMRSGLRPGQIILDTSTSDPRQTIQLGRQLAGRGIHYLEAVSKPVY